MKTYKTKEEALAAVEYWDDVKATLEWALKQSKIECLNYKKLHDETDIETRKVNYPKWCKAYAENRELDELLEVVKKNTTCMVLPIEKEHDNMSVIPWILGGGVFVIAIIIIAWLSHLLMV